MAERAQVMGCDYCGQMHSVLYRCDEQRKAEAVSNKPKPVSNSVSNRLTRLQRWRAANRDQYNATMRTYMADPPQYRLARSSRPLAVALAALARKVERQILLCDP